jgi:hypothetical protein
MDMDRALIKNDEKIIVVKIFKACILRYPLSFNKKGKKNHKSGLRSQKVTKFMKGSTFIISKFNLNLVSKVFT